MITGALILFVHIMGALIGAISALVFCLVVRV